MIPVGKATISMMTNPLLRNSEPTAEIRMILVHPWLIGPCTLHILKRTYRKVVFISLTKLLTTWQTIYLRIAAVVMKNGMKTN